MVGRWQDFFVTAPSRAGQFFQHNIALLHFTAILLRCCVNVRWVPSVTSNTFDFFRAIDLGRPTSLADVSGARDYLAWKVLL